MARSALPKTYGAAGSGLFFEAATLPMLMGTATFVHSDAGYGTSI